MAYPNKPIDSFPAAMAVGELTKHCAEAMDITVFTAWRKDRNGKLRSMTFIQNDRDRLGTAEPTPYDPLNDDAQAMALVKHCKLDILWQDEKWAASEMRFGAFARNADLNRAIVECVAKMQANLLKRRA